MALNSNFRTLTADNIEGLVDDRNYLKASFENGTIQGWTEMAVTLTSGLPTGTPTISSTAAGSIALSTTATTPLSGARSLLVTGAAGWTAGQGFISDEFTLDRMDLGKVLTVSFDYELVSGTLNFSGTLGSQTLMVYIYDATAGGANWIQPAGFLGMNQSSGPGRVTATFQSSVVVGQKYRVAVIASQAVGSACSLEFDNFTCSRVTAPIGPVVTDWVSYTPTITTSSGSITNYTASGKYRRVGDSVQVFGSIKFSAASAAFAQLYATLPSGLSIDTAKVNPNQQTIIGSCGALDSGIANYTGGSVFVQLPSYVYLAPSAVTTHAGTAPVVTPGFSNTFPITFNTNDEISWEYEVPVTGWSSSTQQSSDTDTRVVAFQAYNAGGTATSVPTGATATKIVNLTAISDTHATWNAGSQAYIIPVSGYYEITSSVYTSAFSGGNSVGFILNGSYNETGASQQSSSIAPITVWGSRTVQLKAGDSVSIGYCQFSGTTQSVGAFPPTSLKITRLSGPSVVAASETVAAVYQTGAGQSIPNNTVTPIVYGTKVFDTHSAMNASTGVYTVPVSGTFEVKASHYFGTAITATATDVQTIVQVDGISMFGSNLTKSGTVAAPLTTLGSFLVKANAGQTIRIALLQSNSTASAQSLLANVTFNWISINRVGN